MYQIRKGAFLCPIIVGAILLIIGLFIAIPADTLTTYSFLRSEEYTVIEEYVGGDAYNYIIGASLVAGEITGAIVAKSIFIVAGVLCICVGITLWGMLGVKQAVNTEIAPADSEEVKAIFTDSSAAEEVEPEKPTQW